MRWSLSALCLSACAVDDRLALQLPVTAGGTGVAAWDTEDGGAIALDEAVVTFSDLRLEEPATDGVAAVLLRGLSPSVAHAHPGHDYPGDVAMELLGSWTVDLLGPDLELGTADGYEGACATARLTLAGEVAVLSGTRTDPDGAARPFRFVVTADQELPGLPFEHTLSAVAPPGGLAVRFDPAVALSFVDWAGDEEAQTHSARFGVVATPSWSVSILD